MTLDELRALNKQGIFSLERDMGNASHSSKSRFGFRITAANYFRAAYVFTLFSQIGYVYVRITNRAIAPPEYIMVSFVLMGVYVVPFAVNFLTLLLWIRLFKQNIGESQTKNCYLGVWLLVAILFSDVMFFLPFELDLVSEKQEMVRMLAPIFGGIFWSPIITMLGVLAGLGGYRLSRREGFFHERPEILTLVLFIALISVLLLATWAFGNVGSILVLGLILSGVLGRMVKKYSERARSTM